MELLLKTVFFFPDESYKQSQLLQEYYKISAKKLARRLECSIFTRLLLLFFDL